MRSTLVVALTSLCIAASAAAQEPDMPPPPDGDTPAAYRTSIAEALAESSAGHWEEARALFRRAQALWPNARALRGVGMASFELRDYTEAYRRLGAALDETRQPLTDVQRTQVTELRGRARAFVAVYQPPSLPADATLAIDGAAAPTEPDGTLLLGIGEHRVAVRAGARTTDSRIEVRGGESGALPIDTDPLATAPPPPALPAPAHDARPAPLGAWALTIGGGVGAVVGVILLATGVADLDTVNGAPRGTDWETLEGPASRAPILTGIGVPLLCAGLAAASVGVVWLALGGGTSRENDVALGVRLGGVELRGRW